MAVLFFEDFRAYPTDKDMLTLEGRGGPYRMTLYGIASAFVSLPSLAVGRPNDIGYDMSGYSSDMYSVVTEFTANPVSELCFSFLAGGRNTSHVPNFNVTFTSKYPESIQFSSNPGVCISYNGTTVQVEHRIQVSAGTGSTNNLLVAEGPALKTGEVYHINGKISHTSAQARIILYINGQLYIDQVYNRDRINNDLQQKDFTSISFAAKTSSVNTRPIYRNVAVYTEDSATPFPSLPFIGDVLEPDAGQGNDAMRLVTGRASDAASVVINPGGQVTGSFGDLPASGSAVKALYVRSRHFGTGGAAPSELDIDVLNGSGQIIRSVSSIVASGVGASNKMVTVPASTKAEIDALTFRMSARS